MVCFGLCWFGVFRCVLTCFWFVLFSAIPGQGELNAIPSQGEFNATPGQREFLCHPEAGRVSCHPGAGRVFMQSQGRASFMPSRGRASFYAIPRQRASLLTIYQLVLTLTLSKSTIDKASHVFLRAATKQAIKDAWHVFPSATDKPSTSLSIN